MPSLSRTVNSQQLTINKRRGFTLIELLVVITIIAVLNGAGTVSWTNAQKKGRDAKRKADLKSIQQALELYFQENKYYPRPWYPNYWCTTTGLSGYLEPTYIKKVPTDPLYAGTTKDYYYTTAWGRYTLAASLENTNDPEYVSGGLILCDSEIPIPNYTYQVTQP